MIATMMLVVLVVYLSFVIAVSKWVYKKPEKVSSKWLASIGTAVFLLFVPMADNIVGEVYLKYLCATQGGIHVYQTVELGPEYFGEDGMPLFYDRNKYIDEMQVSNSYTGKSVYEEGYSSVFNIDKSQDVILDMETGEMIGSITYFLHFGGWLVNSTGLHVSGTRCPSDELPSKYIIKLTKKIFLTMEMD